MAHRGMRRAGIATASTGNEPIHGKPRAMASVSWERHQPRAFVSPGSSRKLAAEAAPTRAWSLLLRLLFAFFAPGFLAQT
jgi:hypothetical protein